MPHLHVNGTPRECNAPPGASLLSFLRDELGLAGPKFGCGTGDCGACMVLVDGRAEVSCTLPVASALGHPIVTLEGLGTAAAPHPVQAALLEHQAGQCGYCLSGIAIAAAALLQRNASPTREEICAALDGNLCRCGSHNRIVRAVQSAAERMRPAP